jgi:hypothetical protein
MDNWRKNAPPVKPEQAHINPKSLQQLLYNPYYYTPEEKDLKIGDDIVIGIYASDLHGSPSIKWIEIRIEGLPLRDYLHGPYNYIYLRKKYSIKQLRKMKLEKLHNKI